jgi:asparaginyl-tRNA synthetase
VKNMNFVSIKDAMSKVGEEVSIRGWVYRVRGSNERVFIILRDSTNIIQCLVEKKFVSKEIWEQAQKITVESSCEITGRIKKDERAPTGFEIEVSDLRIFGLAEPFPITKDKSEEFLYDMRHLWLRSRRLTTIMKIRSSVFEAIDLFFRERGFFEITPPILTPVACEGGSTLFEVKYYDKKMYLTQSWQLYAEVLISSLEKIYCNSPCFRAERSKTSRHLSEFYMAEMEVAWADLNDIIKYGEELVSYIVKHVLEKNEEELKFLNRDIEVLKKVKPPFPRITYDDALEILKKDRINIPWGKDLRTVEEDALVKHFEKPVIVTNYPSDVKAFYMPDDPKKPGTVLCYDMLAPEGYGEIIGGSQRSTDVEEIKRKLKREGEDIKKYSWYLDSRKYGNVPHSGFGLGVERVISWICKLENIKEATPFPRTIKRFYP